MKKIFLVAGELSGDRLGAWYLQLLQNQGYKVDCEAVGGAFLKQQGATIYETIEKLNIVGIVEIIKCIPSVLYFLRKLAFHIISIEVDEVVLVDIPAFNLRLAKRLKKLNSKIKITYLSPPQLWVWGSWRMKIIKNYCDCVIVLYPFEVEWYKKRGILAQWYGYPFYNNLASYFSEEGCKEKAIAFILGSRKSEFKLLFPIFARVMRRFAMMDSDLKIVLPIANTLSIDLVKKHIRKAGLSKWLNHVLFVQDEHEKYKQLSKCCLAITKPGTITLELALLGVPSLIIYKVSWLSYLLAKLVVRVNFMGLPNLFLGEEVCTELIQRHCKTEKIFQEASKLYRAFLQKNESYLKQVEKIRLLRKELAYH